MSKENLQAAFLEAMVKEETQVSMYLMNGIKLQGKITAFDQYAVFLTASTTQMVFKHSISTIVPSVPFDLKETK